jgi:acetoin utilization protein AcuB
MSANEPTVAQFMTEMPATADEGLLLADAQERMFIDNIRHLVVQRDGHPVGILSSRDAAMALSLPGVDKKKLTVGAAMTKNPYSVRASAPISEVAYQMEAHRWGCAIVVEGGDAIGVFTTTDALRALRQLATGKAAEPAVRPEHLPPEEAAHARPFRLRRHRPIDAGSGQMFATMPKR